MPDVRMPDGTIIKNVPDGMTRAELERKYKRVAKLPGGKTLSIDVPEGADEETIRRIGQDALNAQNVRGRAVVGQDAPVYADSGTTAPPTALEALGGAAKDFGTNLSNGFFSLPDLASQAVQPVQNALSGIGHFFATGGGASPSKWADDTFRPREAPTMRGVNNQLNPGAYERSNTGFLTEMTGASMVPIGPKGAPTRISAPVAATAGKAASKSIVPMADEIVAAGAREKVPVLTTDIKPPRTMLGKAARNIGERIPIVGTGGVRSAQNQARIDASTRMVEDFGGGDDALAAVTADIAKTRGDQLVKLTGVKTAIIDGIKGKVPPAMMLGTLKTIDAQIAKLNGINAETYAPVVKELMSLRDALSSGKTLSQIEGNRKILGGIFKGGNLANIRDDGQKAIDAIYGPLREDMGTFIEQAAGKPARARWQGSNDRLAAMAGELKSAAFKKTLNEAETTPEGAAKLIFSKTPSEVNRMFVNLSPAGKAKARAAVLFEAARKATDNGATSISPEKFSTAMNAMQASVRGLFDPADAARIEGMVRLLKGTKRASEAGVMTNSGMQVAPYAIGAGAVQAPLLTIAAGLASRLYESAPMRDLLLRLGRASPGSPGYKISYDKLTAQLSKIAPVAANDMDGAFVASPVRAAAEEKEQN